MTSGAPCWAIFSRIGSRSFMLEIFFSWIRMKGFSRTTSIRSGSVTKYGERYPLSNRIPSTTSRTVSMVFDSSTVMTPSLPTFSIASAMMEPISSSLLADVAPLGAEGHLHGVRQGIDAAQDGAPRVLAIEDVFGHRIRLSSFTGFAVGRILKWSHFRNSGLPFVGLVQNS